MNLDVTVTAQHGVADAVTANPDADVYCVQQHVINDEVRSFTEGRGRRLLAFPSIQFNAFHPDVTVIENLQAPTDQGWASRHLSGPTGYSHSLIIFMAWKLGLSTNQAKKLFNGTTYKLMGYHDEWDKSCESLFSMCKRAGFPIHDYFPSWTSRGCFLHTFNHPKLFVLADIARVLVKNMGLRIDCANPDRFLIDPALNDTVWPIYPEIGAQHGEKGDYTFKVARRVTQVAERSIMSLEDVITASFAVYEKHGREKLTSRTHQKAQESLTRYVESGFLGSKKAPPLAAGDKHPYQGLAAEQYWRSSFAGISMEAVDPAAGFGFRIPAASKVATAGSCFAQHIARHLRANGFNYYIAEPAPDGWGEERKAAYNYDVFSARYGNIYTSRQLLQLIRAAFGEFEPEDAVWQRKDGRYVDALRPTIDPDGFADVEAVLKERHRHLDIVRQMFLSLDVFVFTLGLTEYWYSRTDGTAYPLAPGVAAGNMDPSRYRFGNLEVEDVVQDMKQFLTYLRQVNPNSKVILTVSPVPLAATYEKRHVLSSTTYSKSVLRAAADKLCRHHQDVFYFPSYEIITGTFNKGSYYEADLRNVNKRGVDHVMSLFLKHATVRDGVDDAPQIAAPLRDQPLTVPEDDGDYSEFSKVVCDEELLAPGLH